MENNPALPSGKTSPARSAATKAQTSRSSYLNCAASQNQKPPLLLSLKAAGQTPDASLTWAAAALPGEPLTLNFTEYPNAAVGSSLSAILQDNVPDSYSLSPAACRGILRRAFVRGKPLPEPVFTPPTQEGVFRGKDLLNDFYAPNGTYYTVAWNKLYRAEVWKLLHYPEGRLHEDDFVAHRLFWRCDKVVCLPDVLYNYRLRSGSIMRTSLKPGAFDAVDGLADRYRFYVENGADRSVIDSAYAACWRRYLFLCAKVRQNPEPQLVKAISKEQFLMQGLISYLPNCRHMKMTEKLSAARWAMMPAESLCPAK